jgi:hypothetical protein
MPGSCHTNSRGWNRHQTTLQLPADLLSFLKQSSRGCDAWQPDISIFSLNCNPTICHGYLGSQSLLLLVLLVVVPRACCFCHACCHSLRHLLCTRCCSPLDPRSRRHSCSS